MTDKQTLVFSFDAKMKDLTNAMHGLINDVSDDIKERYLLQMAAVNGISPKLTNPMFEVRVDYVQRGDELVQNITYKVPEHIKELHRLDVNSVVPIIDQVRGINKGVFDNIPSNWDATIERLALYLLARPAVAITLDDINGELKQRPYYISGFIQQLRDSEGNVVEFPHPKYGTDIVAVLTNKNK